MAKGKEQILACARDIFLREGLAHFSMRKVAACVGVSATALYRHYRDRDELLFHVLLRGFRLFADYLGQVDEALEPLALLEASTQAYLDFALDERAYYEMMFMSSEQMTGLKPLNREGAAEMQVTFVILQKRVQRAIDSGAIKAADSYTVAYGLWAYAHGQVALYLGGRTELTRAMFVELYSRLMRAYLHSL